MSDNYYFFYYGEDEPDLPVLPYNQPEPNSGHSGSDTSAERAKRRDSSGATAKGQARVLALLASSGFIGTTVAEARDALIGDAHHGTVSGALSNLHKVGRIARLAEKRGGCKIYVLPGLVCGRATEPQGRRT